MPMSTLNKIYQAGNISDEQPTPGPWHMQVNDFHVVRTKSETICTVWNKVNHPANSRLIAAAPELFDALTWALTQIDDDLDLDNQTALEHAKNILKKAKGGV